MAIRVVRLLTRHQSAAKGAVAQFFTYFPCEEAQRTAVYARLYVEIVGARLVRLPSLSLREEAREDTYSKSGHQPLLLPRT